MKHVDEKTFYEYVNKHKLIKQEWGGALHHEYVNEAGERKAFKMHGFAGNSYSIADDDNTETEVVVGKLF